MVAGGKLPPEPPDGGTPRAEMKVGAYTLCAYPAGGHDVGHVPGTLCLPGSGAPRHAEERNKMA